MTPRAFKQPTQEERQLLEELAKRSLTAAEFDAYVNAPMTEDERADIRAKIEWFSRRYPTARERLAAARRQYAAWTSQR